MNLAALFMQQYLHLRLLLQHSLVFSEKILTVLENKKAKPTGQFSYFGEKPTLPLPPKGVKQNRKGRMPLPASVVQQGFCRN
jgi:hypothetical protein